MATIDDVARAAGVSTSTVSYVLSGKRPISAATRLRVERSIRDLAYRPHAGARALASSRTNVIGLMAPLRVDVNVSVIMQFVTGVVTAARTFDHDVLLLTQDDATGLERVADGSMVDALIMMDIEADDPRVPVLVGLRQPAVLIGLPRDSAGLSCVDLDFDAAGRVAVRHLASLGHRRIALIGSPRAVLERHTSYADRMLRGFTAETRELGLVAVAVSCESSHTGAIAAVDEVLESMPDVTALVVHNEVALPAVDLVAIQVEQTGHAVVAADLLQLLAAFDTDAQRKLTAVRLGDNGKTDSLAELDIRLAQYQIVKQYESGQ